MPAVVVKHGKAEYAVELDAGGSVADFKAAVFSVSGVPPERQKLMSKAWKLALKDDASFTGMPDLKDGLAVTLMGSADAVAKPAEKTVFVEDLPASASVRAGLGLPAGLANLGNTCYANSTLEALRAVPELSTSLVAYKAAGGAASSAAASSQPPSPYGPVVTGLADLLTQLGGARSAVAPAPFLTRVRSAFPRFAEQGQFGVYKQQDADEFYVELMRALAAELTRPSPAVPALAPRPGSASAANVIDTLFGVPLEQSYRCLESDAEPPSTRFDFAHKLPCNIDGGAGRATQVNHLHEGVMLGLTETVTKEAPSLGRNAQWSKTARLAATPRYLCVQLMRFYWKATPDSRDHAGVKCKMLRPVAFPADNLDVYDWCAPGVQAALKVHRDAYSQASVFGSSGKGGAGGDAMAVDDAAAGGGSSGGGGSSSAAATSSSSSAASADGLPANFRGLYELFAVVTHKGRSADSGHYMAWVRREGGRWLVYDDDAVSETDTDYVTTTLKGGGDDHMAYLLFYRAKA